jgi:hypothetical protein
MASKNNPGQFDCYTKAHGDEPMFVLLGRDPMAGALVRQWIIRRRFYGEDKAKLAEAVSCASALDKWAETLGKRPQPDGFERMKAPPEQAVAFIEWMADGPCTGNGSGIVCRKQAPNDPEWCCPACRAALLRYGA